MPWKRIGVVLKSGREDMAPVVRGIESLLMAAGLEVLLEREAAAALRSAEALSLADVTARADMVIVFGGDGTVLATARGIGERDAPILGVNLGRLGFLTDVHPDDACECLATVLRGEYELQSRTRLDLRRLERGAASPPELVLNDVVLSGTADVVRMIELEAKVDGRLLARYRADGLIAATATGSTAYNLSAGGPILDPQAAGIVLTPISPHSLSQRPLVLGAGRAVEVVVVGSGVSLTLDGQVGSRLDAGQGVLVRVSPHPARFVIARDLDPFETLRTKLGWAQR